MNVVFQQITALYKYSRPRNILLKTFSFVVSLKTDIINNPPLFLSNIQIPEVSSVRILMQIYIWLFLHLAETYSIGIVLKCGQ